MLKLNNGIRAKWQPGHGGRPTASPHVCVCVWVVIPFVWSTATEAVPLKSIDFSLV